LSEIVTVLIAPSPTHALIHIHVHRQKKNSVYGNSKGGREEEDGIMREREMT